MKTLEQYEAEKKQLRENHGTGIQCPACGDELIETNPGVLLLSYPPKKDVHCPTCKYKNYITA